MIASISLDQRRMIGLGALALGVLIVWFARTG